MCKAVGSVPGIAMGGGGGQEKKKYHSLYSKIGSIQKMLQNAHNTDLVEAVG